jgi:hypothetical protein
MYPKYLECSSQVTKSTSRIPRNNRTSSLKVYILSQFNEYCLSMIGILKDEKKNSSFNKLSKQMTTLGFKEF